MEWLYAGVFGSILLGFMAYGFKLFREDKKILNEYKKLHDMDDIPGSSDFLECERPFIERYKEHY
jgi:hypothetical protein